MQFLTSFLAKNWKAVAAIVVVAAVIVFFQIQLWVADSKYKDMLSQRDGAIKERQEWHDSHIKLQSALAGVEADKKSLQSKLDQAKVAEAAAVRAANYNSAEAARVASLLRQIRESSNDPEYSDRVRSRAIDFLRERQQAESPAGD